MHHKPAIQTWNADSYRLMNALRWNDYFSLAVHKVTEFSSFSQVESFYCIYLLISVKICRITLAKGITQCPAMIAFATAHAYHAGINARCSAFTADVIIQLLLCNAH